MLDVDGIACLVATARVVAVDIRCSGCGPSEQALADVRAAPTDAKIVVMPLDSGSAAAACTLTLSRLTRLRPYLAPLPENWKCHALRAHALSRHPGLQIAEGKAPVYQLADRSALGWSENRRAAVVSGSIEAAIE